MRCTPQTVAAALAVAVSLATTTCARPETDIVSTSTEDTGGYRIVGARDGDTFNARLCVSNRAKADVVTARLLRQLYSRGYRTIAIEVYDRHGAIARLVWRGGSRRQEQLAGAAPPEICGAR
jgi:hypothetical protein